MNDIKDISKNLFLNTTGLNLILETKINNNIEKEITIKDENCILGLSQYITKDIVNTIYKISENNKLEFNVDEIILEDIDCTTHKIYKKLFDYITSFDNIDYIITNGNMASVIQDISDYNITSNIINTYGQLYPVGKIGKIDIYVNPYMLWSDNRIFLGSKDGLIFEYNNIIKSIDFTKNECVSQYNIIEIEDKFDKFKCINVIDTINILI